MPYSFCHIILILNDWWWIMSPREATRIYQQEPQYIKMKQLNPLFHIQYNATHQYKLLLYFSHFKKEVIIKPSSPRAAHMSLWTGSVKIMICNIFPPFFPGEVGGFGVGVGERVGVSQCEHYRAHQVVFPNFTLNFCKSSDLGSTSVTFMLSIKY